MKAGLSKVLLPVILLWFAGERMLPAQTNPPASRLAIIADADLMPVVDVLTVALSRDEQVTLLERAEINRVIREQELSVANKSILTLGRVLGADGLLVLEKDAGAAGEFLRVQLVAVRPGVVLSSERFGWPLQNPTEWATDFAPHLRPFWPKLGVLPQDAVPLSVVNLRSAIQSSEARELERQLTLLAIERLSREPRLFITERRRLHSLAIENEWNGFDDSAFWDGSFLLDGTLDSAGYSADTVTISARLIPPKGGTPVQIEVSGRRADLVQVINRLAAQVLQNVKPGTTNATWNAADEAELFYAEARWAMKWRLYPQAQAAAESAWALGLRTPELASLRLRAYSEACLPREPMHSENTDCVTIFAVPDADKLQPITRALELFAQGTDGFRTNASDVDWLKLGHRALRTASGILEGFYYAAEARVGREAPLEQLRAASRRAADILNRGAGTNSLALDRRSNCLELSWLNWNEGGVWFEHPEEALPLMRETLAGGFHPTVPPRLIGWTWEDRKRVPGLQKQFIAELCAVSNVNLRLEGKCLALRCAPTSEPDGWQQRERELLAAMWEDRAWLFRSPGNVSLVPRVEELLREKHGLQNSTDRFDDEAFSGLRHRLRSEYFTTLNTCDSSLFQQMLSPRPKPAEARELLPLVKAFAGRATEKAHMSNWIVRSFCSASGLPFTNSPAPKPEGSRLSAEAAVTGRFVPWRLARAGIDPDRVVRFSCGQMHNGRLWFAAHYFGSQGSFGGYQAAFIEVDTARGVTQEIPFPESRGFPGAFLVNGEHLFTSVADKIECYSFRERHWKTLPFAVEGTVELLELPGRRFVATKDNLLELAADLRSVEVVASSRRQPPKHELDSVWANRRAPIVGVDGKLGIIVTNRLWLYDPSRIATTRSPNFPVPAAPYFLAGLAWEDGWLVSVTGQPGLPRHLLAYSTGATNFESVLQQRAELYQGRRYGPALVKQLPPPKWDWPEEFPFEHALLAVELRALWALNPRKFSNDDFSRRPDEPVIFSDDRNATLFRFEPEFRQPIVLRVCFAENDQKIDPFIARQAGFSRHSWTEPTQQTWLPTQQGLVLAVPKAVGHWLIPRSVLEAKLTAQRKALGDEARSRATPSPMAAPESNSTNRASIRP